MYEVEDSHWWYRGLREIIHRFLSNEKLTENCKILDVGCGTGRNSTLLQDFGTVVGLDVSPTAIQFSKQRGHKNVLVGNASNLPFNSSHFDVVCMMDVLYHRAVPDKLAPLKEIHRVLKKDGILLINVPAYQWLTSSHDLAIHTDKRFKSNELAQLLNDAELSVERLSYWNTFLFPLIATIRTIKKFSKAKSSDLENHKPGPLSPAFLGILKLEAKLIQSISLPFGLSIFAVGKK
jgi:ubiquinone/menaquinone biosynthesis C-methylase UbiE